MHGVITTLPNDSRSQRVDINIDYSFLYDDLTRTKFWKLSLNQGQRSKGKPSRTIKDLDGLPLLHTEGILFVDLREWRGFDSRTSAPRSMTIEQMASGRENLTEAIRRFRLFLNHKLSLKKNSFMHCSYGITLDFFVMIILVI